MLDTQVRPLINRPLDAAGIAIARLGVSANAVSYFGLGVGLAAAFAIAHGHFKAAFVLIVANRILDGVDGAVARATAPTDSGGYLDIVVDYVFYASVPLAFAVFDPALNALPAAALLAAFCLTCSSFLAFAAIAAKRRIETEAHGRKSFFYSTGIIEGTETVVFFLLITAFPRGFPLLAWIFAGLCVLTAVQRSLLAFKLFDHESGNPNKSE
ncbi:MAG: CDP-alcohol phosphatidyltransferase family protein [Woeseia sp.]|nr:CDP-alcohol phosphatidyltransferase family protein [Woeseia sp.]